MRSQILLLLCVLMALPILAQKKRLTEDSKPGLIYPVSEANAKELGLNLLATSGHRHHYRFSVEGQIIEIWTDDDSSYQGFLLNYVYRRKRVHRHTILSEKENISPDKAKQIISLYDSLALNRIPAEEKIRNWQKGLDGGVATVEFANPDLYSIKNYWEPGEQKQVPGIYIGQFFNRLNGAFQLKRKYMLFLHELPIGSYFIGMIMMTKTIKFGAKGGSSLFRK